MGMKRLFRKGERVRSKLNGKVMEVLKYIKTPKSYKVECAWYDLEMKEVRVQHVSQNNLLRER